MAFNARMHAPRPHARQLQVVTDDTKQVRTLRRILSRLRKTDGTDRGAATVVVSGAVGTGMVRGGTRWCVGDGRTYGSDREFSDCCGEGLIP